MRTPGFRLPIWISVLSGVWLAGNHAAAVTPESPEVKEVVEKALKFLENPPPEVREERLGAKCLIGLCFLKNNRPLTHPRVQAALKACEGEWKGEDNYTVGIAIMFLCEADPDNRKPLIEQMVAEMLSRQQEGGGWSYRGYPTGDTSQTQYGVLAIWMAQLAGVPVPVENQERALNWLIRTQDPQGGHGYQGIDPKTNDRVPQNPVHGSVTAAGLSSMYILADMLHLTQPAEQEENVPQALKLVKAKGPKRQPKTNKVDLNLLKRALADGNNWLATKNTAHIEWTHYYYYAIERLRSFRELAEGKFEKEPQWYNEIFAKIRAGQDKLGAIEGKDNNTVATCFAVLFLSRSAKKAIAKVVALGDGVLLGGMGLPPNSADLKEKNGKVQETPLAGGVEELLALLEDEDNPELARMAESTTVIELDPSIAKRGGQIVKLREMVSAKSFESRLIAVRSLAKVRDLDNVPVLLYALTDPDLRVIREADKALRFVSRKFEGVGLSFVEGHPPSPAQLDKMRADWRKWYLSIRPDAELLD